MVCQLSCVRQLVAKLLVSSRSSTHVPGMTTCQTCASALHDQVFFSNLLFAGSCLVLKGNGADVAQHCVPPVNARRMSITLRRYTWTAVVHLATVSDFVASSDCLDTMMRPFNTAVERSCS